MNDSRARHTIVARLVDITITSKKLLSEWKDASRLQKALKDANDDRNKLAQYRASLRRLSSFDFQMGAKR